MPLLSKRSYEKKDPWRDATIFVIICEGSKREPEYFEFFHLLTEKVKIVALPSVKGQSAPTYMINSAHDKYEKYKKRGDFELWVVIDVDRWKQQQINNLQREAKQNDWNVVISNPCFEVWLNNHAENPKPPGNTTDCQPWKEQVGVSFVGGFSLDRHPTYILRAIEQSKNSYSGQGYMPDVGCTQVYRLGKKIYELSKTALEKYYP